MTLTTKATVPPMQASTPPEPQGGRTVLYVVAAFVIVNIIGGGAYLATKKTEAKPEEPTAGAPANGPTNEMIRALRVAGLDALEHGDYPNAVATFTDAITKGGTGDLPELLRIAKDLEERKRERNDGKVAAIAKPPDQGEQPAEDEEEPPEEVEEKDQGGDKQPRRSSRRSRPRRSTPTPPPPAVESEPEPPAPGLILVTSTPSGLVVAVDGEEHDLTPARVTMPPGSHRVTISKGTTVLHTETVEVTSNRVVTVDADLEEKLRPEPPPPPPVVAAVEPAPLPPPPTPEPERAPEPDPAPKEPALETGDLFIESPNVFGTVFVNDKAVGTPPIVAKGLPIGDVRIEVRVDGVVRKQKRAVVKKNQRVKVVLN